MAPAIWMAAVPTPDAPACTSAHRPLQTPFVVVGQYIDVIHTNLSSGSVIMRGRIIDDPTEYPARSTNFLKVG